MTNKNVNTKDRWGFYAKSAELMVKHMPQDNNTSEKCKENAVRLDEIKMQYKEAETELISHIRTKVSAINGINELVSAFRDACLSIAGLGVRADVLKGHIDGEKLLSQKQQFNNAIWKGIAPQSNLMEELGELLDEECYNCTPYGCGIYSDCNNLIDTVFGDVEANIYDGYALVILPLLRYLDDIGSELNIFNITEPIIVTSCADAITSKAWAYRALIGFFTEHNSTVFNSYRTYKRKLNKAFVNIFANKITLLFNSVNEGDPDYFVIARLRDYLHTRLSSLYFRSESNNNTPLEVYRIADNLLRDERAGVVLGVEALKKYAGDIMLEDTVLITKQSTIKETTYQINKVGLESYLQAVESLGLSSCPYVDVIIKAIRQTA